ncbi:RHS repeat-associated core domain-containing protein [Paenibacillus sp. 481]|uniref:RHS repeat-associated core domain-containing protein n=1 Tax=Paenibacillus sp. 481 TaxID=2835869 RepID=UPI001E31D150|nr:RHS repeat-associated core domain-containing protein [Paenibacillus sp. 481]UHA71910.1 RHS repeat protein [Paenibacillus sp. 481]
MKKVLSVTLVFILIFTSLPFASAQPIFSIGSGKNASVSEAVYGIPSHQQPQLFDPNAVITISSVADQFGIARNWVHKETMKGYPLHHVFQGLKTKQAGGSYEQFMQRLYPHIKSDLTKEQNPLNVTFNVYGNSPKIDSPNIDGNPSVTEVVYPEQKSRNKRSLMSSQYDEIALKQKDLRVDQAPFSIGDVNVNISTVDGSLRVEETDFILPGPNGMNFELRRTYDSARAKESIYFDITNNKNATRKPQEDKQSALGKGWIWDIPYIKMSDNDYPGSIYIPGKGTYSIDNSTLKGYPYKDLSFRGKGGEKVGNATFILDDHKTGLTYFFNINGQLIVIVNKYGNQIDFHYAFKKLILVRTGTTYEGDNGRRLYNQLEFSNYDDKVIVSASILDPVTNQPNKQTVEYRKETRVLQNRTESITTQVLTEVIDQAKRSTKYYYDDNNYNFMFFNFSKDLAEYTSFHDRIMKKWGTNVWLPLKTIEHPTKAHTDFDTEKVLRNTGPYAQEEQVRYRGRVRSYSTPSGPVWSDLNNLNYHSDVGSRFGDHSFSTSVSNGLRNTPNDELMNTTYHYQIDYKEDHWGVMENETPTIYNTSISMVPNGKTERKNIYYEYNMYKRNPNPIQITTAFSDGLKSSTQRVKYEYDEYGHIILETNPLNITSKHEYVETKFTSKVDEEWKPPAEEWDREVTVSQLKKSTVPIGTDKNLVSEYEYYPDHAGLKQVTRFQRQHVGQRLLSQSNYEYDRFGNPTTIQLKGEGVNNTVIKQEFDNNHKLMFLTKQTVTIKDADNSPSEITNQAKYNPVTGSMIQYIDGKGQAVTYEYDALNRVTAESYADGTQTKIVYNDASNTVTVTDPADQKKEMTFDPFGRLVKETSTRGVAYRSYDKYNRLTAQSQVVALTTSYEDAIKHYSTEYVYDAWGRVIEEKPKYFASKRYTYDDALLMKSTIDGAGNVLIEKYDILGRVEYKEEIKPSGIKTTLARYTYDHAGNVISMTDANGNVTTYQYDGLSRLNAVTDAESKTTNYKYDLSGNMVEVTYADGNKVQKKYDEIGRLIQQIDPKNQSKKLHYDANSNVIRSVDRKGQTQYFEYNMRNLLTSSFFASQAEERVSYQYDRVGRRTSMTDSTGTTNYEYHPSGELNTITYPGNTRLNYEYDVRGLRTKQTIAGSNFSLTTNLEYMADSPTPTKVQVLNESGSEISHYKYDFNQQTRRLSKLSSSQGFNESYMYDGLTRIGIQQKQHESLFGQYDYSYDNNRNITAKKENGSLYSFTYDKLNRIQRSSQFNESYQYDGRDNRSTLTSEKPTAEIIGGSYTYDNRNQLTNVMMDNGKSVAYRYNGDGLMVERTENGTTIRYYYDDKAKIVAEGTVGANNIVTISAGYVYDASGKLLARKLSGENSLQQYITNGHGDVTEIRDANGKVLNQYTYDIWGDPLKSAEQTPNIFRYSGEYWDSTTNLQYLRARWYDPSVGRFINEDTYEGELGNPLSQNLYTYVENNPLKWTDPTGHRKGLDFSFAYNTLRYGYEMGSLVDYWWDGDISDQEFFDSVGISFKNWDDINLTKGNGYYDDSPESLKYTDEINVAQTLSKMGKKVKTIQRDSNNTPDFLVDGVKVELKTAYPEDKKLKVKTSTQAVAKGFNKQGASEVVLDLRYGIDEDLSALHIFDLYYFSVTKLKQENTLFKLHIWTDNGIYSGNIRLKTPNSTGNEI